MDRLLFLLESSKEEVGESREAEPSSDLLTRCPFAFSVRSRYVHDLYALPFLTTTIVCRSPVAFFCYPFPALLEGGGRREKMARERKNGDSVRGESGVEEWREVKLDRYPSLPSLLFYLSSSWTDFRLSTTTLDHRKEPRFRLLHPPRYSSGRSIRAKRINNETTTHNRLNRRTSASPCPLQPPLPPPQNLLRRAKRSLKFLSGRISSLVE